MSKFEVIFRPLLRQNESKMSPWDLEDGVGRFELNLNSSWINDAIKDYFT